MLLIRVLLNLTNIADLQRLQKDKSILPVHLNEFFTVLEFKMNMFIFDIPKSYIKGD
jgi:hypothetical protein